MIIIPRLILTALIFLPLQFVAAQERTPNTLEPITDDLYIFKGGSTSNHYGTVLVTSTIDSEWAEWLSDELKRHFDQPVNFLVYLGPGHSNSLIAEVEEGIEAGQTLEEVQSTIKMDEFKFLQRWDERFFLNAQGVNEQLVADNGSALVSER